MIPRWIAIDGPSGSGKSSAARGLAIRLGWAYLDTGATYRAATLVALEADLGVGAALADIDPQDPYGSAPSRRAAEAVERVVSHAHIVSGVNPQDPVISLEGRRIDKEIRSQAVTRSVSITASIPGVRRLLVAQQRALAEEWAESGMVVEGRDIGAVVLPDAPLRVYLTASAEARARRRASDPAAEPLDDAGESQLDATHRDLERRDAIDESRADNPAGIPIGAIVVDSSDLSLEDTIQTLISLYRQICINEPEGGHGH